MAVRPKRTLAGNDQRSAVQSTVFRSGFVAIISIRASIRYLQFIVWLRPVWATIDLQRRAFGYFFTFEINSFRSFISSAGFFR